MSDDPNAEAIELAKLGPDPIRWIRLLHGLADRYGQSMDLEAVERALDGWPDDARSVTSPSRSGPHMALVRTVHIPNTNRRNLDSLVAVLSKGTLEPTQMFLRGGGLSGEWIARLLELELPSMGRLKTLALRKARLDVKDIEVLAGHATMAQLQVLDLGENTFGDEGAGALAASPHLAQLRELVLDECKLGAPGVEALVAAPFAGSLERLDLASHALTDEAVGHLAEATHIKSLHTLALSSRKCAADALEALVGATHLHGVEELRLDYWKLRDAGAKVLSASPLGALKRLGLRRCLIRSKGAQALFTSDLLDELVDLDFAENQLGVDGVCALAESAALSRLESLCLNKCKLDENAASALGEGTCLTALAHLKLNMNALGDTGAAALAHSPTLQRLQTLTLSHNGIGPDGVRAWLGTSREHPLSTLDLSGNEIGDEGAAIVAGSPDSAHLEHFHFSSALGVEGQRALATSSYLRQAQREFWLKKLPDELLVTIGESLGVDAPGNRFALINWIAKAQEAARDSPPSKG